MYQSTKLYQQITAFCNITRAILCDITKEDEKHGKDKKTFLNFPDS